MQVFCTLGTLNISDHVTAVSVSASSEGDKTESVTIDLTYLPILADRKLGELITLKVTDINKLVLVDLSMPLTSVTVRYENSSIVGKGPRHKLNDGTHKRRTFKRLTLANLCDKVATDNKVKISYPSEFRKIEIEHLDQRDITDYALLLREIKAHGYVLSSPLSKDPVINVSSAVSIPKSVTLSLVDATSWTYATKDKQDSTDKTETSGIPSADKLDYKAIGNQGNQVDAPRPLSATSSKVGQHNLQITKASSGASTLNVSYPLLSTYTGLKPGSSIKFLELPQTWQITSTSISIGSSNTVELTLSAPTMEPLKLPQKDAPIQRTPINKPADPTESFNGLTGVTTTSQPKDLILDEPVTVLVNETNKLTVTTLSNNPITVTVFDPTGQDNELIKIDPKTIIAKGLKFLVVSDIGYYVPLSKVLVDL
jgi:hypothetical protein